MRERLRSRFAGRGLGKLASRSGWTLAATLVTTLCVFAETILLARHLGPSGFGVFLLVIAFPEAVLQVLDLRVKDATNKYFSETLASAEHARSVALLKLFWVLDFAVGAISLLIVFVAAGPVAAAITGDSGHADLMIIYAFGLFLGTLDTAAGTVLRVLDRFRLAFFGTATGMAGRLLLVVTAVVAGGGLESVVWARAAGELLMTVAVGSMSLVLLKRLLWEHRRTPVAAIREQRREILGFLMSTNLTGTLKMASTKLDTLLLGALATPAAVALYRFALQFARAPLLISDALYSAVFPTFARAAARGRREEIRQVAFGSTKLLALTMLPGAAVAAVLGGEILGLVGGARYSEGHLEFALIIFSVMPYALLFWLRPLILTAGHAGRLLRFQALGTVVQMVLLVALVPWLEAEGAALALAVSNVLIVAQQLMFARRMRLLEVDGPPAEALPPLATRDEPAGA